MFRKIFLMMLILPLLCIFAETKTRDINSPSDLAGQYNEGVKGAVSSLLETVFDQNSHIIIKNNIIDKVNNYDTDQFLGLVQKKVIGSWKNDPKISYLYEDANNASIKLESVSGKTGYTSYLTCFKSAESWKIVNVIIAIDKISE
jgi:hypothetical protein